ncbi:hypothetical protein SAMN05216466_107148 [Paraburkholderia phenazinium]|uniref:Uncharacterized protein n=1 Tax=Paraburkholderia phenazinium TaxID=60549 RepID=A0A1G7ZS83_9BURK|nr:hypothetical protein [Paraburkholderia phenazinium]SDH11396.1 hypothetical protein SAMN05216466_107148 [Paraburkholderia phenazinium]
MSEETKIINAPERIWLQVGDDFEPGAVDFSQLSEVTWCEEIQNPLDIEYVRVSAEVPFVDSYGFEVLLGDRMYIDNSMQYRNGTTVLTIKRKPREIAAAPTESK